jgi:hypothetical protein
MAGAYRVNRLNGVGAAALAIALDLENRGRDAARVDLRKAVRNIVTNAKPVFGGWERFGH